MDMQTGKRAIQLKDRIVSKFEAIHWDELDFLLGVQEIYEKNPRLKAALHFNDDDYEPTALRVIAQILQKSPSNINKIEEYLDSKFPSETTYISSVPSARRISFAPNVFQVPEYSVELDLVSIMMPFGKEFSEVHDSIRNACSDANLRPARGDDIWEQTTFIQDIFNLIVRSFIVIVDLSGKNPNVMYETGIAHTLGKHVIPIAQSIDDVPSDMRHHRALPYLRNAEGLATLRTQLAKRLRQITTGSPEISKAASSKTDEAGDDIPF
jgi:hypothetical protein